MVFKVATEGTRRQERRRLTAGNLVQSRKGDKTAHRVGAERGKSLTQRTRSLTL